jgi:hypothetical protein
MEDLQSHRLSGVVARHFVTMRFVIGLGTHQLIEQT